MSLETGIASSSTHVLTREAAAALLRGIGYPITPRRLANLRMKGVVPFIAGGVVGPYILLASFYNGPNLGPPIRDPAPARTAPTGNNQMLQPPPETLLLDAGMSPQNTSDVQDSASSVGHKSGSSSKQPHIHSEIVIDK